MSSITPSHAYGGEEGPPIPAFTLAQKKRDRENKENKEKLSSQRREIQDRKSEYQVFDTPHPTCGPV